MINYDILIDMKKSGCIDTGYELSQGDKELVEFNIILKNGSANYMPEGDATIVFKKANNTTESGALIPDGNKYNYKIKGSELSVPGYVMAEIKTYDSDTGRASSSRFKFLVKADLANYDMTETGTYIGELEHKIIEANALIDQLTQSRDEALQMIEDLQGENFITSSAIVDNLLSTDNTKVLSANQGRIIGEALEDFETELNATNDNLATHLAESVTEIITSSIDVATISNGSTMYIGAFEKKPKHISVVTRLNNQAAASWGEIDANNNQASMAINSNGVYSGSSLRAITIDMLGSSYAFGVGVIESDNRLKIIWSKGSGSLTGELVIFATANFHGGE